MLYCLQGLGLLALGFGIGGSVAEVQRFEFKTLCLMSVGDFQGLFGSD